MISPLQAVAAAARLASATIQIELDPAGASLEAVFSFAPAPDSVQLVIIRFRGQELTFDGEGARQEPGLWRLTARPGPDGTVRIHYRITGPLARLPLPVPSVPSLHDRRAVSLRVAGIDPTVPLGDAFPRFERDGTGPATAVLADVPSLIQLGQPGGWRWLKVMDWGIVGALALVSLGWYRRYRQAAR